MLFRFVQILKALFPIFVTQCSALPNVTFAHLFRQYTGTPLSETLSRMTSDKKRMAYLAEETASITGLSRFPQYLTLLFEIDGLVLNDDRNLNNIAVIARDGGFDYCPIFDQGAGPSFLFGMAASMFPRRWMAWALWGIHIAGALFASLVIPEKSTAPVRLTKTSPHSPSSALNTAIQVMATVCGWVVLFRVLLAFLKRWIFWILPTAVQVAITGILELSNGCCELLAVPDVSARFCICSGLLAFGGLCVTMQTVSVTAGLSTKPYFLGKLLQTLFSLALAVLMAYGVWLPFGVLSIGALVIKLQKKSSFSKVIGV